VKRLWLREAARLATLSRGCRQFFRARLNPEQAGLLEVLQKGVPGRMSGPQLGFLRQLVCDAIRGRLFSVHRESSAPVSPSMHDFCIDSEGQRLQGRRSNSECLEVFLGWHERVKHQGPGQPDVWVLTLPNCRVKIPGGASIKISWTTGWPLNPWDRVPTNLAELSVSFEHCKDNDADWLRALLLAISLFVFEEGFAEREERWKAVPGGSCKGLKTKILIECAPRIVSVLLHADANQEGTDELRLLAGMQGLVQGTQARGFFHVGPNRENRFRALLAEEDEERQAASEQRKLIENGIRRAGASAILLLRVVNNGGFEAEGVVPHHEMEPLAIEGVQTLK
jgi:hypothetical protein